MHILKEEVQSVEFSEFATMKVARFQANNYPKTGKRKKKKDSPTNKPKQ